MIVQNPPAPSKSVKVLDDVPPDINLIKDVLNKINECRQYCLVLHDSLLAQGATDIKYKEIEIKKRN